LSRKEKGIPSFMAKYKIKSVKEGLG